MDRPLCDVDDPNREGANSGRDMDPERRERPDGTENAHDLHEAGHDRRHDEHRERNRRSCARPSPRQASSRNHALPGHERDDRQTGDAVCNDNPPVESGPDRPREQPRQDREDQECEQGEIRASAGHILMLPPEPLSGEPPGNFGVNAGRCVSR